jgi:predicted tellurium resistance membrane protein TerC
VHNCPPDSSDLSPGLARPCRLLGGEEAHGPAASAAKFGSVIVQILLLDMVFRRDSVSTAVGMSDEIGVMIAAVPVAVGVMLV